MRQGLSPENGSPSTVFAQSVTGKRGPGNAWEGAFPGRKHAFSATSPAGSLRFLDCWHRGKVGKSGREAGGTSTAGLPATSPRRLWQRAPPTSGGSPQQLS